MINGMLYFRGHRKDFDEWEEMGNPGWGWEGVLPFFKSAERWSGPINPNGTYGTEGRFNIMYSPFRFKVMWTSYHNLKILLFKYPGIRISKQQCCP